MQRRQQVFRGQGAKKRAERCHLRARSCCRTCTVTPLPLQLAAVPAACKPATGKLCWWSLLHHSHCMLA
jgi:hypothetical protein